LAATSNSIRVHSNNKLRSSMQRRSNSNIRLNSNTRLNSSMRLLLPKPLLHAPHRQSRDNLPCDQDNMFPVRRRVARMTFLREP